MEKLSNFAILAVCLVFVGACTPQMPEPIGKEAVFNKFDSVGSCGSGHGFDSETNLCMPNEKVCKEHDYNCDGPTDCGGGFEFNSGLGYCVPIIEHGDAD